MSHNCDRVVKKKHLKKNAKKYLTVELKIAFSGKLYGYSWRNNKNSDAAYS